MNNIQKRFALFLGLCIPSRLLISYLGYKLDKKYLPYLGIITLTFALGFLSIYFFGNEKADAQLEWVGQKKVWWNHLRIVHGLLYLGFSISIFLKKDFGWMLVLLEATIGLIAFLYYHYSNNNFSQLFI